MGYYTTSTTGYGFSLSDEEREMLWDLYEERDDAIDWIVEERDEYAMLDELFKGNPHLTGVTCEHMGELLGTLVLAEETVTNADGFGIHESPRGTGEVTFAIFSELTKFAKSIGIDREPSWLTEVSYG